jgi:hypothetical protein
MIVLTSQLPSEMEIETFSVGRNLVSPYRGQRARLDFAQDSERPNILSAEWIDRNQVRRDKLSTLLSRVEEAETSSTRDLEILAREDRIFNPRRFEAAPEFTMAAPAALDHQLV